MSEDRLERRDLRKHLMARGWVVESRVSGAFDVQIPSRTSEAAFLEVVCRTVRECGQEPDAYPTASIVGGGFASPQRGHSRRRGEARIESDTVLSRSQPSRGIPAHLFSLASRRQNVIPDRSGSK